MTVNLLQLKPEAGWRFVDNDGEIWEYKQQVTNPAMLRKPQHYHCMRRESDSLCDYFTSLGVARINPVQLVRLATDERSILETEPNEALTALLNVHARLRDAKGNGNSAPHYINLEYRRCLNVVLTRLNDADTAHSFQRAEDLDAENNALRSELTKSTEQYRSMIETDKSLRRDLEVAHKRSGDLMTERDTLAEHNVRLMSMATDDANTIRRLNRELTEYAGLRDELRALSARIEAVAAAKE